jgi:hypothetical protein
MLDPKLGVDDITRTAARDWIAFEVRVEICIRPLQPLKKVLERPIGPLLRHPGRIDRAECIRARWNMPDRCDQQRGEQKCDAH